MINNDNKSSWRNINMSVSDDLNLLLVDDHELIRSGIKMLLSSNLQNSCIHEARDCKQALDIVSSCSEIDLALLDIDLPDMSGFDFLDKLRDVNPLIPVAFLSASTERSDIDRAISNGARGFIPKSHNNDILINAIKIILNGGMYIPYEYTSKPKDIQTEKDSPLSDRQLAVLFQLQQGASNKQIANNLHISESTARAHVSAILSALGARNRTEAALIGVKKGLIKNS